MNGDAILVIAAGQTTFATAEEVVARLIAAYNVTLELLPYRRRCECVGTEADWNPIKEVLIATRWERADLKRRYAALRAAVADASRDEATGRGDPLLAIDTIPQLSVRRDLGRQKAELDMRSARHEEDTRRALRRKRPEHPLARAPNPECEQCAGSGERLTATNPQAGWSEWRIGGGSAGLLDPNYDPGADPRNFSACEECDPISHLQYVRRELRTGDAGTDLEYQREGVIRPMRTTLWQRL